jgi:hypothetical protein
MCSSRSGSRKGLTVARAHHYIPKVWVAYRGTVQSDCGWGNEMPCREPTVCISPFAEHFGVNCNPSDEAALSAHLIAPSTMAGHRMQHLPFVIYLQSAVFAIATILSIMLVYETSPRTRKQAVNVVLFAALTCYQIYQWPLWS